MIVRVLISNQAPESDLDVLRHLAFEHKITFTMYTVVFTEDAQVVPELLKLETAELLTPIESKSKP